MLLSRLGLVAFSLVIGLVLAEVVVRTLKPVPEQKLLPFEYNEDRVRQIAGGDTYLTHDTDLGWTLTPSRTRRAEGDVYRINSQSIRSDREYALDPPQDVRRITAFGDSFTHCSESTQADCWAPRLEQAWPGTEVLNFGVPGFGPDQAWLRYRRDGKQHNGCAVLIGFYVGDIERVVNRFRGFISPDESVVLSKPRFLLDGDALTLLPNPVTDPRQLLDPQWTEATLGPHDAWYVPGMFVKGPLDSIWLTRLARTAAYHHHRHAFARGEHSYPLYDEDQEAFQVTLRILIGHAEDVRANGATPVVVIFPGELDLEMVAAGAKPYGLLIDRLRSAGLKVVDLTSALSTEGHKTGLNELFEDTHYSKRGNTVVANELARALPPLVDTTCQGPIASAAD
jgi:hypothetical protein